MPTEDGERDSSSSSVKEDLQNQSLGWISKESGGGEERMAPGCGRRVTPSIPEPGPRGSRCPVRPGAEVGGGGSCQKMRPWPRASAAAAFIFKLLSGQRARRGTGPRPAINLILGRPAAARPPSGPSLAWLPAYLRVLPARAPHVGRSPWLWRQWRFWRVSATAAAAARGQDGDPAAHPARPAWRATT